MWQLLRRFAPLRCAEPVSQQHDLAPGALIRLPDHHEAPVGQHVVSHAGIVPDDVARRLARGGRRVEIEQRDRALLLEHVEAQRQRASERHEVVVRRQDGESVPFGHGTQEKVGVRALNPFRTTEVEAVRGPLVVGGRDRLVGKRPQGIAESLECCPIANATEEFLPQVI
jgi:hypothetical protein